ncbi:hypothetical protein MLD38_029701 [Melastoma candidum]|uniref:Uncharacterized protein n=1 Tax=Melastoma candidum TaxID=119954 RepID=A0ACB9N8P1_9MYRT|nr:hypothetical protein MLD38_029701 [Melastoma candidum]
MFTSDDNGDDFDDHDTFVGHQEPFSPYQDQGEIHHNHQHYQLSLFNLPTPYHSPCFGEDQFDYVTGRPGPPSDHDLDLILFHHQQQEPERGKAGMDLKIDGEGNDKEEVEEAEKGAAVAYGRSSKKDRHSKITTARGTRDRRMRLSLEVAREFFDLQDMLEFDKASKTVEWLISQSKSAIKDIIRKVKGNKGIAASYASDSEIGFDFNRGGDSGGLAVESLAGPKRSNKENKARQTRRRHIHQRSSSAVRESRMKARERARERTLEKNWKRCLEDLSWSNPRKRSSSSVEGGEESSCIQDQMMTTGSNNLETFTQYEEITGMAGRMSIDVSSSDLVHGKWSPAAASSSNPNLQEMGIPQPPQQRDCEQFFKQWKAYCNYGFDPREG